jgi:hypothetical protein
MQDKEEKYEDAQTSHAALFSMSPLSSSSSTFLSSQETDLQETDASCVIASSSQDSPKLITKTGSTSKWWKFYKVYHPQHFRDHPDLQNKAVCINCNMNLNVENGLRGLSSHLKYMHQELYQQVQNPELTSSASQSSTSIGIDQVLKACKRQTGKERKGDILAATAAWVIEENQPLNATSKKAFRCMIEMVEKKCPVL